MKCPFKNGERRIFLFIKFIAPISTGWAICAPPPLQDAENRMFCITISSTKNTNICLNLVGPWILMFLSVLYLISLSRKWLIESHGKAHNKLFLRLSNDDLTHKEVAESELKYVRNAWSKEQNMSTKILSALCGQMVPQTTKFFVKKFPKESPNIFFLEKAFEACGSICQHVSA